MRIAKRLAIGTGSWLNFEFQCHRGQLFEEKYLSVPIGQILASEYGNRVVSEINHPLLDEHTIGPGKRPKMDFAVIQNDDLLVAMESKWAGSTPLKVEAIIWDLIRLELVAHHYQCVSLFVLAGQKRKIKALFESEAFRAPKIDGTPRPVLKDGKHRSLGMKLDTPPKQREVVIKRLVRKFPDIEIPSKISSGQPSIYPSICKSSDFQVYVWEIIPAKRRESFTAKNHRLYAK